MAPTSGPNVDYIWKTLNAGLRKRSKSSTKRGHNGQRRALHSHVHHCGCCECVPCLHDLEKREHKS